MRVEEGVSIAADLPGRTTPILSAHVAGVALTSPDIARLAAFYVEVMGYSGGWDQGRWIGWMDGRWLSIVEGRANTIDHVAFALSEADGVGRLRGRLANASIPFEEVAADDRLGAAIALRDPDGNRLLFGSDAAASPAAGEERGAARLQHIVFASDATVDLVRFYCDVIGFAASDYVRDARGDLTSAFLNCGPEHHSLALFRAPAKRMDHLCFDIEAWSNIRDWADRFASHHVQLRWGPGRHGPGNNLFFFVNDPDGNWLEFSAELERLEAARPIKNWVHEERTLNSWGAALMRS